MSKNKSKSIGSLIKHYRILKNLTQEDLAELLNLSYQQVQKYEYNKTTPPLDKLILISKVLEIPIEMFFKENLRSNLIDKIESEVIKNYEFIKIIKENPDLLEIIKFYEKNKTNLEEIDVLKLMKEISNIPKNKKISYIDIISKILQLPL